VLDAHRWAIYKMVVKIMFTIVKQYMFNQTQQYWLLFGATNATLSISLCMQNEIEQYDITPRNIVKGDCEYELVILRMHMMIEVQVVLGPFLFFAYTYNDTKVHNILALLFNSYFKSLDVVKTFVGWAKVIQMVA